MKENQQYHQLCSWGNFSVGRAKSCILSRHHMSLAMSHAIQYKAISAQNYKWPCIPGCSILLPWPQNRAVVVGSLASSVLPKHSPELGGMNQCPLTLDVHYWETHHGWDNVSEPHPCRTTSWASGLLSIHSADNSLPGFCAQSGTALQYGRLQAALVQHREVLESDWEQNLSFGHVYTLSCLQCIIPI